MGIKAFAYKVKNAVVEIITPNKVDKVIDYGKNNTFPNDLLRTIYDSGTATRCIEKRIACINADGFQDDVFSKQIINDKGQTADEVLADLVPDVAVNEGGAFLITYHPEGSELKPSAEHVEFEYLRKYPNGNFVYNEKFGTKEFKKEECKEYEAWNPKLSNEQRIAKIADDQVKHKGQRGTIFYFFVERPGKRIYSIPSYYSDIENIKADSGLQKTEESNVNDGFKADAVIKVVGEFDDTTKRDNGKTDKGNFDDEIAEFQEPGGRRVLVLASDSKDSMAEIDFPDQAPIYDSIDKACDRIPRRVCRDMSVPPVLIGMDAATILGNQQALSNAIKLFNADMLPFQNMISGAFKKIFPTAKTDITTSNLFTYIDPLIAAKLTDDELRILGGFPVIESEAATDAQKTADALGALSPLVVNKVLESMDEDEIRALVGLPAKTKTTPPNVNP